MNESHITVYYKMNYDYISETIRINVRKEEITKTEHDKMKKEKPTVYVHTWFTNEPTVTSERIPLNSDTSIKVSSTTLNILTTRLDGMKKELQLSIDEFSQHYSTKNSNYENMVKNITNMILDLFNEIKSMLRN